jgi:transposase
MKQWDQITHYGGFDWAKDHHNFVVVDRQGQIVADFEFPHSQPGWKEFAQKIKAYPGLALAIETSQGAAIEQLLQIDCQVYPVNPVSAKQYRSRKVPSGNKTDHVDAWALGDALRVDGHGWGVLKALDPKLQELRLICRDEIRLIEERTALVNQLQQALLEYYPAALESFDEWTQSYCWDFVIQFPTPQVLVKAGKGRWNRFLHAHRLWRPETSAKRLEIFSRADQFGSSSGVTAAKSLLAVSLAKTLKALQKQLDIYREQITKLFREHPDHDIFGSMPGAGEMLAPRLLAEVGDDPNATPTFRLYSVWPAPRQCISNPAKSAKSSCGETAIRFCGTPSTSGPTAPAKNVSGPKPTTRKSAKKAKATPARCAAWASGF